MLSNYSDSSSDETLELDLKELNFGLQLEQTLQQFIQDLTTHNFQNIKTSLEDLYLQGFFAGKFIGKEIIDSDLTRKSLNHIYSLLDKNNPHHHGVMGLLKMNPLIIEIEKETEKQAFELMLDLKLRNFIRDLMDTNIQGIQASLEDQNLQAFFAGTFISSGIIDVQTPEIQTLLFSICSLLNKHKPEHPRVIELLKTNPLINARINSFPMIFPAISLPSSASSIAQTVMHETQITWTAEQIQEKVKNASLSLGNLFENYQVKNNNEDTANAIRQLIERIKANDRGEILKISKEDPHSVNKRILKGTYHVHSSYSEDGLFLLKLAISKESLLTNVMVHKNKNLLDRLNETKGIIKLPFNDLSDLFKLTLLHPKYDQLLYNLSLNPRIKNWIENEISPEDFFGIFKAAIHLLPHSVSSVVELIKSNTKLYPLLKQLPEENEFRQQWSTKYSAISNQFWPNPVQANSPRISQEGHAQPGATTPITIPTTIPIPVTIPWQHALFNPQNTSILVTDGPTRTPNEEESKRRRLSKFNHSNQS